MYENLEFKLPPAGIVVIVGPNGAGKTTLFRMIMEQEKADSGTFKVGETVKIAYVDQQHADIDMEKTIWEQITGGLEQVNVGGKLMNSRAYVAKFNFNGADQNKKIGVLSGGERNRLHLALTLRQEANVLLLDEPTNHLDPQYQLEVLKLFKAKVNLGCSVITTMHDVNLAARYATQCLLIFGDGNWIFGNTSKILNEENLTKLYGIKIEKIETKKQIFFSAI